MRRPRPQSSPLEPASIGRIRNVFARVRRFVSFRTLRLLDVGLAIGCPEITRFRVEHPGPRQGDRAFMHVGHAARTVCASPAAGFLADGHLVGLVLHEFGHLGSGGGERAADRWVLEELGIPIHYVGPLELEWVAPEAVGRILGP